MGRRFRLGIHRKNEERKCSERNRSTMTLIVSYPRAMIVSFPLEKLPFCVSWPLSVFTQSVARCLRGLQQRLVFAGGLPPGWVGALEPLSASANQLDICKLSRQGPTSQINVAFNVTIQGDFSWTLHICGREVETRNCSLLPNTPEALASVSGVLTLLREIEESRICVGNPQDRFSSLSEKRKGVFKDQTGTKIVAYRDTQLLPFTTIRHSECEMLLERERE